MRPTLAVCLICLWFPLAPARGEDAYYRVRLNTIAGAKSLGSGEEARHAMQGIPAYLRPNDLDELQLVSAIQIVDGEGYLETPGTDPGGAMTLAIRGTAGHETRGEAIVPSVAFRTLSRYPVYIAPNDRVQITRREFLLAKSNHYKAVAAANLPGAAVFRHELLSLAGELPEAAAMPPGSFSASTDLDAMGLFTGGRGISENLALNHELSGAGSARSAATIPVSTLSGITTPPVEWKTRLGPEAPRMDSLAALIPADQHAIFFPNVRALLSVQEELQRRTMPVFDGFASESPPAARWSAAAELAAFSPAGREASTLEFYRRQLGITFAALEKLPVKAIAVTGSDLYFKTGTDVALLFDSPDQAAVLRMLDATIKATTGVDRISGKVAGNGYFGYQTADRQISAYVAQAGPAVVLSNSLAQLERILNVQAHTEPALTSLDEYRFFRQKYTLGDPQETAFMMISDAAIRRWCSPQWRIASLRRTMAQAHIADLQAGNSRSILLHSASESPRLETSFPLGNTFRLDAGVFSEHYGTLQFLTPIRELSLARVSAEEARLYEQWRSAYESGWRRFDPIALRLTISAAHVKTDLTIMPLRLSSQYTDYILITRGAQLAPPFPDTGRALLAAAIALNADMTSGIRGMELFIEDGTFWTRPIAEWQKGTIPIALVIEAEHVPPAIFSSRQYVQNPSFTPYRTEKYARYSDSFFGDYFGCAIGTTFIASPNEPALKAAIDRQLARAAAGATARGAATAPGDGVATSPYTPPCQFRLSFSHAAISAAAALDPGAYQAVMQQRAFANIPILNYWKSQYPARDPVAVHEQLLHERLVCPGGGRYVWNEHYLTMESTVYGHPLAPRNGPTEPDLLQEIERADFVVGFENEGLHAVVDVQRSKPVLH
ncbi:MAG TPA: hypothetical protein VHM90_05965 [Phycisphaerae bacterium]|nr:hypothetical protein [Phycisphaerae bacterium]